MLGSVKLDLFLLLIFSIPVLTRLDECLEAFDRKAYRVAADICQSHADALKDSSSSEKSRIMALLKTADSLRALGRTVQALHKYGDVLLLDAKNEDALTGKAETALKLGDIVALESSLQSASEREAVRLKRHLDSYKKGLQSARSLVERKYWNQAIRQYNELLTESPESSLLLSEVADCYLCSGNYQRAIDVLRKEAASGGDSSASYFAIGKAYLAMGDPDRAMKFIGHAARDYPDLPGLVPFWSRMRKLNARLEEATSKDALILDSIKTLRELLKDVEEPLEGKLADPRFPANLFKLGFEGRISRPLCINLSLRRESDAANVCRRALDALAGDSEGRREISVALIEALIKAEDYPEAMKEVKAALESNPGDEKLRKLYGLVQEEQRKAKNQDYYKILGVSRDATAKDLKKAYKRLSKDWHPDKHPQNPKQAEAKMRDINKAYEVLSEPEKRAIFDQTGADPDDQEAQAQARSGGFGGFHGFHGFPGGGGGFGDGGFQFVFRDAQGREWRQHANGGGPKQGYQQQQRNRGYQQQQQQGFYHWDL